ncbi:HNH endonuclease [Arthrobacter phage Auxilium]|uniref:HNH endonuclease n=1 Tax=Arthrobacter phage Auxilium TaxID=2419948 RepID=A0A3G2KA56_9CAUD|nr:HNH endonuclease [Arthrobacter phage Auxilium]AYN55854.1 HNH endonuclease [Arthrobacter phage Auxilium]
MKPHRNFDSRWTVTESGFWEWSGALGRRGYGQFWDGMRTRKAHRYALELSTGLNPDRWTLACHTCDNPPCVNPGHLFWGTPAENSADMVAKGRSSYKRHRKVPPSERPKIAERRLRGEAARAIAREYGVSPAAIYKIVTEAGR